MDIGEGGFTTGMAFDDRGHLFVTGFSTHKVYEFDTSGGLVGVFATMDGNQGRAGARHRHRVAVSVVFLFALIMIATQGAGAAVWRLGLLAEACRRLGLALRRQLG